MQQASNITGAVHQEGPPRPSRHLLSDGPLPFGKLMLGQEHYNEFACSKSTAGWLIEGAMTHIDGREVRLQVKEECVGGHNLIVGFWFTDE